ncbi:MAG: acyl-ACP thioesterase [Eubacterium sp.]|nr:acyl-ACP thioesterase [Eubacterium sp.]
MAKFSQDYRPIFADCDSKYDLKPQTLLAWACELAGDHLRSRSITREDMWDQRQVFLLTTAAMHFDRVPVYNSPITLSTWESGTKGARFVRSFDAADGDGNIVCDLQTLWVLVDPQTHSLYRPAEYKHELDVTDIPTVAQVQKHRVCAEESVKDYTFVYSDIDANGHVNNGVYLRLLADLLPATHADRHFGDIYVSFLHEARQGQTVSLYVAQTADSFAVVGKFPDGNVCFEAEAVFQ